MNAPKASCMTWAMHGMWFLNASHWIPEALSVDCSLRVISKKHVRPGGIAASEWSHYVTAVRDTPVGNY
jgi:hypothetical protein